VPTIVVRFALPSEICAQNPKSAARGQRARARGAGARTELDVAREREQDVVRLDVAVDHAVAVEVLEALARLAADGRDLALRHQVRGHDVRERAALHVLHDDPEVVLVQEAVDVVHDVRVPRGAHDEDLVDDQVLLRLLVEVHLLDRDAQVRPDLVRRVHAAGRAVGLSVSTR
jgi:hypothetical protein